MNNLYNADYSDDLNIVCVDLNKLENFNKIVLRRFEVGARWLDDIISNLNYNYDDNNYYENNTEKSYQKEYNKITCKY